MTIAYTQADTGDGYSGAIAFTWVLLTANADGKPLGAEISQHTDLCWTATGTFGGATASLEGSNDGSNWFPLTNASGGSAATFTAAGGKQTVEKPIYVRPNLSAVGVGATVTVILFARRNPFSRR